MSAYTMDEVWAPINARYKAQVFAETWGHLAPSKNKTYRGSIVFAVGIYGGDDLNPTMLACEFAGLDDSPWFFDACTNFLSSAEYKAGNVYRFDGSFRNYKFAGRITQVFSGEASR
jgi:hypothetical protein